MEVFWCTFLYRGVSGCCCAVRLICVRDPHYDDDWMQWNSARNPSRPNGHIFSGYFRRPTIIIKTKQQQQPKKPKQKQRKQQTHHTLVRGNCSNLFNFVSLVYRCSSFFFFYGQTYTRPMIESIRKSHFRLGLFVGCFPLLFFSPDSPARTLSTFPRWIWLISTSAAGSHSSKAAV